LEFKFLPTSENVAVLHANSELVWIFSKQIWILA